MAAGDATITIVGSLVIAAALGLVRRGGVRDHWQHVSRIVRLRGALWLERPHGADRHRRARVRGRGNRAAAGLADHRHRVLRRRSAILPGRDLHPPGRFQGGRQRRHPRRDAPALPLRHPLRPWADVKKVVLWQQPQPYGNSVRCIGLERRRAAPPLAGRRGRRFGRATARALVPDHVSGDTLLASRAINSWRLDTDRLTAAVEHFAPDVKIVT